MAVMQPYFLPYAGYFRLFDIADTFVVLDDVQFPRRGYVHRNKFLNIAGEPVWFTLPLAKAPQETRIDQLVVHHDWTRLLEAQLSRLEILW